MQRVFHDNLITAWQNKSALARRVVGWVILLMTGLVTGCARPEGVIFEPLVKPLVWPAPPEATRVIYIGQISTSADLKPAVGFGESLGEILFGKKSTQSMLSPFAVCTDGANRVFIADTGAQVVHVFDLNTRKYAKWIPKEKEAFTQPVGLAWDPAGRLFVSDSIGGCIFIFDNDGKCLSQIGGGELVRPAGLAFDARTNRLFVADTGGHRIVVLSPEGHVLTRIGERGIKPGQFNYPTNVVVDHQGRLYVSDTLNFRIQQFNADLKPVRMIGRKGDMPGYFSQPKGIAVDSEDHLYVVDAQFEAVQIFDSEGRLLLDFGEEGQGPGKFWLPAGLFIDRNNRIWVADSYNRRVQVFDYQPEKTP